MKNVMFKGLIFFLLLFVDNQVFSQFGPDWHDKITWDFSVEKKDVSHAYVVASAKLKKGWHVYSVNHNPEKASFTGIPTKLTFSPSKKYKLIGKLQDTKKPLTHNDDLGTSLYFEGTAIFKQEIEFLQDAPMDIALTYSFMIC